jgi:hypothetical protein
MESYAATRPTGVSALREPSSGDDSSSKPQEVAAVTKDPAAKLTTMMERLMERIESLENLTPHGKGVVRDSGRHHDPLSRSDG